MIRPLEWDERTTQAAGLSDLTLRVYLPDGACIMDRRAHEERSGRYVARLLLGEVLYRPISCGPVEATVEIAGLDLEMLINGRRKVLAFGHEDGALPLDSEEAQGGLVQQVAARSPLRTRPVPNADGTYGLLLTSDSLVEVLGGTALDALGLAAGQTNYVRMIGQHVILRWYSADGDVDDRIGVMITGARVSAEVAAAAG